MARTRCLIVEAGRSPRLASEAEQALRTHVGFDPQRLEAQCDEFNSIEDGAAVLVAFDATQPSLGTDLCCRIKARKPGSATIALVDGAQRTSMVDALSFGASDFIAFPCTHDEIVTRVQRALGQVPTRISTPTRNLGVHPRIKGIVGQSEAIVKSLTQIPLLASCDAGLLILGETGTGKEVFAQAVHYVSARASKPWVAVNCGAIPVELLESELFGHVKGAFTTAHCARQGLVPEAEGGTLFLDDVDCLPMSAQAKLLRFLQELEYRPVGSNRVVRADVRVIASSNRSLEQLSADGSFRQDLFYRLNVLAMTLPPLRERRDDIGLLANHFTTAAARKFARPVSSISPQAFGKLVRHDWPGNVRELQHVMDRAVLLANDNLIRETDLDVGEVASRSSTDASFRSSKARVVDAFERGFIRDRLTACAGNVSHAAREAGKDRRAFFELMRKHSIQPEQFRIRR